MNYDSFGTINPDLKLFEFGQADPIDVARTLNADKDKYRNSQIILPEGEMQLLFTTNAKNECRSSGIIGQSISPLPIRLSLHLTNIADLFASALKGKNFEETLAKFRVAEAECAKLPNQPVTLGYQSGQFDQMYDQQDSTFFDGMSVRPYSSSSSSEQ